MHFQAIAFALIACVLVSAFASREVNGQASARVTVSLEPVGVEVPQSFLGFAPEYNAWKNMGVGDFFDPRNGEQATSIRLLNRLGDYNGPPSVRIGGYSQDKAWWDPDGAPYLPTDKIRFDITPEWVKNVRALVEGTHCRLILGLNLGFNRPEAAAEWARVALESLPEGCIEAFEIGNEPDAFIPQKARTAPWTFEMFCEDFERFTQYLRPLIPPGIPLAGPAAANSYEWRTKDFIERFHAQIGLVTVHKYIFQPWIEDTESHHRPSVANMLAPWAVEEYVQQDVIDAAHAHHLPVRYAEINSTTNGLPGVSDSFASALWCIDLHFRLAQAGATGINFWPSTSDAPFVYDEEGGLHVKPLYYGMLFFAQAVQNRARLVPVRQTSRANCRAWATVDRSRVLRVVILNKELTAGHSNDPGTAHQPPGQSHAPHGAGGGLRGRDHPRRTDFRQEPARGNGRPGRVRASQARCRTVSSEHPPGQRGSD